MTEAVIERAHALCAPSGWDQWSACAGSVAMQIDEPDETSPEAEEGIRAHALAVSMFQNENVTLDDPEMQEYVNTYVLACLQRCQEYKQAGATHVEFWWEQRLSIEEITGEKDAKGTADFVILAVFADHAVLETRDLKYGIGVVVDVIDNGQLQIYAMAAVLKHRLVHNITQVVMVIHQVRVREKPIEWQIPVEQLFQFCVGVAMKAGIALQILEDGAVTAIGHLEPGEKQCKFCRAKYKCPALAKQVQEIVMGKFQDLGDEKAVPLMPEDRSPEPLPNHELLGMLMRKVPLIEEWTRAIRARTESTLLRGEPVPGWKLVEGRRGSRQFREPDRVEKLAIAANVSPAILYHPRELKSVTQLEKPLKKEYPNLWAQLTASYITQTEGKPSVAEEMDPRPQWSPKSNAEQFDEYDGSSLV